MTGDGKETLGENVYASIYGHVGTKPFAAMTLTNPLQALVMGALSGISQAAGVMIGKRLGADDTESAYQDSLRSGGRTTYVMAIDLTGTWIFGVPLGLFSAFVLHLPIATVYFILSMKECIRVAISLTIFRKKSWMQKL